MADNSQQKNNDESEFSSSSSNQETIDNTPDVQGPVTDKPLTDTVVQETVTNNMPDDQGTPLTDTVVQETIDNTPVIQRIVANDVPVVQETVANDVPVVQGTVINEKPFSIWDTIKNAIKKITTADVTVMAIYFYLSIIFVLYILVGFILTNCVVDNATNVFNLITGITNKIIFPTTTTTPVPSKKQCVMPTTPPPVKQSPSSGKTITITTKPKTTKSRNKRKFYGP